MFAKKVDHGNAADSELISRCAVTTVRPAQKKPMKLRACFAARQLLFLCGAGTLFILILARASADVITTVDNRRQEVKVVGVSGSNLQVQVGAGTLGIPLASIKEVQMAAPPELTQAQQAFAAKDYKRALVLAVQVTEKYKGIPADWAQLATGMIGDIYVAMNDLTKAEAAYKEYQRLYPGSGSIQADVGIARIAVSKKDFSMAKQKLEPLAAQALKERNVPRSHAFAFSQAFYILGQVKESEGNVTGALEDYLRTVTIFHHDPAAVSAAQERADALRKEHNVSVP
jgi:tetratricopeptide (TPR) repeat protein